MPLCLFTSLKTSFQPAAVTSATFQSLDTVYNSSLQTNGWNLKIAPLEKNKLRPKPPIFGFHVDFREGISWEDIQLQTSKGWTFYRLIPSRRIENKRICQCKERNISSYKIVIQKYIFMSLLQPQPTYKCNILCKCVDCKAPKRKTYTTNGCF